MVWWFKDVRFLRKRFEVKVDRVGMKVEERFNRNCKSIISS